MHVNFRFAENCPRSGHDAWLPQGIVLLGASLLLATALALGGCRPDAEPAPLAFPDGPSGQLQIAYPLDGTLFPPEIVAPTFVWEDETEGVASWTVLLRFDDATEEELRFPVPEPRWRPTEEEWREIKRRTEERDGEVAVVGVGAGSEALSSATVRIRTSTDPVGDSIFYREVPLPFIEAVQDPSRIRWRFGSIESVDRPPVVLENLPVCGNCHSFSHDGGVLGLDVDYGNDKGGYAILPGLRADGDRTTRRSSPGATTSGTTASSPSDSSPRSRRTAAT